MDTFKGHTEGPWELIELMSPAGERDLAIFGPAQEDGSQDGIARICLKCKGMPYKANGKLLAAAPTLVKERDELRDACEAVLHALENNDLNGAVVWIRPPYCAEAVHESASERLRAALDACEGK